MTRLVIAVVLVLLLAAFTVPMASAASIDMSAPNAGWGGCTNGMDWAGSPNGMDWAGAVCPNGLPTWSG